MREWVLAAWLVGGCGGSSPFVPVGDPVAAFVVGEFGIYRFDDTDADHLFESAGERRDFISHDALSDSIYHSSGGLIVLSPTLVLYADNHTLNDSVDGLNAIYALRDEDGDGLAMSAGEGRAWFAGNAPPIWEIALGGDGAVYGLRERSYESSSPRDVIRFVDGNADDDVDDPGEETVVAVTSNIVYDFAVDAEGAIWYIEPGEGGGLYRTVNGVSEEMISVAALNAQGFFTSQDTHIDILDGAPIFDVTDQRNPFGGTLVMFRDSDVHAIWQGRLTDSLDQQILFTDFDVLPDDSVMAMWASGNNYNGALYRIIDGRSRRLLDPRALERNGTDQPRHAYSVAAMLTP